MDCDCVACTGTGRRSGWNWMELDSGIWHLGHGHGHGHSHAAGAGVGLGVRVPTDARHLRTTGNRCGARLARVLFVWPVISTPFTLRPIPPEPPTRPGVALPSGFGCQCLATTPTPCNPPGPLNWKGPSVLGPWPAEVTLATPST